MSGSSLGAGRVVAGVVGGIILGVWLSPAPVPETKFIKVQLPPEVIIEEAPPPEIRTVTEVIEVELPESCKIFVGSAKRIQRLANRVHNNAKEIYDRIDSVDGEALVSSTAGVDFEIWVHSVNTRNSGTLRSLFEHVYDLDSSLNVCKADIEAAND